MWLQCEQTKPKLPRHKQPYHHVRQQHCVIYPFRHKVHWQFMNSMLLILYRLYIYIYIYIYNLTNTESIDDLCVSWISFTASVQWQINLQLVITKHTHKKQCLQTLQFDKLFSNWTNLTAAHMRALFFWNVRQHRLVVTDVVGKWD